MKVFSAYPRQRHHISSLTWYHEPQHQCQREYQTFIIFRKQVRLAFFMCLLWWCVHSFSCCSILGGFLAQKSPFPKCSFAALDETFFGLPLFSRVVALLVSFLPLLYKEYFATVRKSFFLTHHDVFHVRYSCP